VDVLTFGDRGSRQHFSTSDVSTALIALLIATTLSACSKAPSPEGTAAAATATPVEALQITVAPVALRPTKRLLKFVGTLFGNEEVKLSSQVEGQIEKITVDLAIASAATSYWSKWTTPAPARSSARPRRASRKRAPTSRAAASC
jgi:hypothetical protein